MKSQGNSVRISVHTFPQTRSPDHQKLLPDLSRDHCLTSAQYKQPCLCLNLEERERGLILHTGVGCAVHRAVASNCTWGNHTPFSECTRFSVLLLMESWVFLVWRFINNMPFLGDL